jgi:hypothetical protein
MSLSSDAEELGNASFAQSLAHRVESINVPSNNPFATYSKPRITTEADRLHAGRTKLLLADPDGALR